jgi:hypothetical protein
VILVGESVEMHRALIELYMPHRVVVRKEASLEALIPALKNYEALDGKPTAYVCRNSSCRPPTHDIQTMLRHLDH